MWERLAPGKDFFPKTKLSYVRISCKEFFSGSQEQTARYFSLDRTDRTSLIVITDNPWMFTANLWIPLLVDYLS
jgi:hypothetical protein